MRRKSFVCGKMATFLWDRHEPIWIGFDAFVHTVACVVSMKQQNSLWREQCGLLSHMWGAEKRVLFAPAAVSSLKMRFTRGHLHWVLLGYQFPNGTRALRGSSVSSSEGIPRIPSLPSRRRRDNPFDTMLKLSGLFCRYCGAEENRLAGWQLPISMRSLHNRQSMSEGELSPELALR